MSGKISHRCCWPTATRQNPFLSCEEVWRDSECEVIIYLICSPNKLLHLVWVLLESGFWLDLRVDGNRWRSKLFDHLIKLSLGEMFSEVVDSRFSIPILFLEVIFFETLGMNGKATETVHSICWHSFLYAHNSYIAIQCIVLCISVLYRL